MEKDFFAGRRSIRRYSRREVPSEMLEDIITRAMRAPTCGNMQLYSVIVNRDPEMKRKLAPLHFNQPMVEDCAALLTVCADYGRFTRWCRLSGADPGYDNLLSFVSAMTDAVILAQQITAIAESEGLGTVYLGTVTYNADRIGELLELPELVVPVACLAIGWPDEEGTETERLPYRAVVHDEKYRHDSDTEIMELFRAKDEYPANRRYVDENGKESLAQVFTDIRYPRAMNEEFSQTFLKLLKDKKFLR